MQEQINVILQPNTSYKISINDDTFEKLINNINEFINNKKALVVISEKVNKLYGKKLLIKNSIKYVLKDGEKEKNFKNYQKILNFALKNRLERKDVIIAVGGGVVGDLAGFAASTYLRGIDFIQIPTTLLACVDSSVGGKTAVNTDFGKNLAGTFYQPKAVFCNINFIDTLDERQYKTGLAEVLKYAFIEESCQCDEYYNLYEYLDKNIENIKNRNHIVLMNIIKYSLEMKKSVVEKDEKEAGLRRILNFGHTYAHAVEKITNYKKFTHGEAVAIGMIKAFEIAKQMKICSDEYANSSIEFINNFQIISSMPKFSTKKIIELMKQDKKAQDGKINYILPSCAKNVEILKINLETIF